MKRIIFIIIRIDEIEIKLFNYIYILIVNECGKCYEKCETCTGPD